MKRLVGWLFVSLLITGISAAQSEQSQSSATASQDTSVSANKTGAGATSNMSAAASAATTGSDKKKDVKAVGGSQLQAGSTMQAELTKPLDARKNKVGDSVIAKTTQDVKSDGRVVVPKGSKIVGHVTEVRASTKGQADSAVGIAFERAILRNGIEFPLSLTVQAIGHAQAATTATDDQMTADAGGSAMGSSNVHSSGGGLLNGATTTTGRVVNTAGNTAGAVTNTTGSASAPLASGSLTSTSQGVVGLRSLSLSADASNATHGSVITSNGGNVHLDSGTEMILRVNQ
jgi:hypothetical protein